MRDTFWTLRIGLCLAIEAISNFPAGTYVAGREAMIAVLILSGCVAVGLVLGLVATATAPLGYQDESGFHYGPQGCDIEIPCGAPQPRPA